MGDDFRCSVILRIGAKISRVSPELQSQSERNLARCRRRHHNRINRFALPIPVRP